MNNRFLETKLRKIIHDRGQYSAWPNLFFVIISIGLLDTMLRESYLNFFGLMLIVIGSILRLILVNSTKTPIYQNDLRWNIHFITIILIGLGWGINYTFVHHYYGLESNASLYSLLILAGLLSAAITTMAPAPLLYIAYVSSALIFPLGHFIFDYDQPGHLLIAIFILVFCIFHFYHASVSYDLIKTSILNDKNFTDERDKIQALINAVPGFVSFIDEEMKYQTINEYGKAFYNESDIIGKQVGHLHPNSQFSHFVQDFMSSQKTLQTEEIKIEIGERSCWFIATIKKIETYPRGAVIVSVPIDELVNARKDLEAQQAKAHYASKLASLGEMAASIAHEINNPLAIIQGSAEQLSRAFEKENITKEKGEQLSKKITETTERISKIVKSLKVLSRNGEKDPFKDFLLCDVINDCVEVTRQNFYEKQIKFEVDNIPKNIIINGQQVQISQVIMNLVNNAYHAIEEINKLKWIKITFSDHNHYIELKVIDSGKGIPDIIKDKIMEPFFTTKDVGKGTGLGLSISKSIIENHCGTLKLDNQAENTTFTISIPTKTHS